MHILIVDDKQPVREKIATLLSKLGYTFECANNGLDALEKAQSDAFNLYIIDHLMPVMNGIKLIANLKSKQVTSQVPIIFMSTQDINTLEHVAELKLIEQVISKPIDEKLISQLLKQLLVENSLAHSL